MSAVGSKPGIDVIVVNYRTPGDLDEFLDSLRKFTPTVPMSVVVCDVDPLPDQTIPDLTGFVQIEYKPFHENVGYARAVNWATTRTNREVIAIFNADVVLSEDALDRCHAALLANDDWGVLGPLQTNGKGRITHAGIFGSNREPKHRGWQAIAGEDHRDVREAVTVSGSAYFVRRDVWAELSACPLYRTVAPSSNGSFLPTQHYYEETWCSYHARAHGWKVMYYGLVEIVHRWHRASEVGGQADREMPRSREYFRQACDYHQIDHD